MSPLAHDICESPEFRRFLERIGGNLRRERRRAGLTLDTLAERAGLTMRMVQYAETGSRAPSLGALWRLALALNVPPRRLFS